jgi:hypothetical protein
MRGEGKTATMARQSDAQRDELLRGSQEIDGGQTAERFHR